MWFTNVADLILDLVRETRVEITQSAIAISLNLGYHLVEVNHIVINMMGWR